MALITCPECGREVSDKATSCPNCGYPINDPTKPDVEKSIMIFKGQRYDITEAVNFINEISQPDSSIDAENIRHIDRLLQKADLYLNRIDRNELIGYLKR